VDVDKKSVILSHVDRDGIETEIGIEISPVDDKGLLLFSCYDSEKRCVFRIHAESLIDALRATGALPVSDFLFEQKFHDNVLTS
jgi:hypothetical protein